MKADAEFYPPAIVPVGPRSREMSGRWWWTGILRMQIAILLAAAACSVLCCNACQNVYTCGRNITLVSGFNPGNPCASSCLTTFGIFLQASTAAWVSPSPYSGCVCASVFPFAAFAIAGNVILGDTGSWSGVSTSSLFFAIQATAPGIITESIFDFSRAQSQTAPSSVVWASSGCKVNASYFCGDDPEASLPLTTRASTLASSGCQNQYT